MSYFPILKCFHLVLSGWLGGGWCVMTMRNYEQWMWCQVWYKTTVSPIHTPNVTVLTTADDLPIHNSNSPPMQPLMPVICCYYPITILLCLCIWCGDICVWLLFCKVVHIFLLMLSFYVQMNLFSMFFQIAFVYSFEWTNTATILKIFLTVRKDHVFSKMLDWSIAYIADFFVIYLLMYILDMSS